MGQKTIAPDVQVPQKTISVFAQQTGQNLFILITALDTVPAQRVGFLVKSVVRGVVPVHFSNVLSFLRKTNSLSVCNRPTRGRKKRASGPLGA